MDLRECLVQAQITETLADTADSETERQKWEKLATVYRRLVRKWVQDHRPNRFVDAA